MNFIYKYLIAYNICIHIYVQCSIQDRLNGNTLYKRLNTIYDLGAKSVKIKALLKLKYAFLTTTSTRQFTSTSTNLIKAYYYKREYSLTIYMRL
jgi:hypothetical protein